MIWRLELSRAGGESCVVFAKRTHIIVGREERNRWRATQPGGWAMKKTTFVLLQKVFVCFSVTWQRWDSSSGWPRGGEESEREIDIGGK